MSTQTLNPALALVENLHSSIKGYSPSQELKSENDGNATTNSASLAEKLSDKIICHAWQRMISIYGHKWSSHLGFADDGTGLLTDAAKTWQKGLSGVTLEQLKYGFDMLIFKNHDWPPSLPEFRKLCLSNVPSGIPSADEVLQVLVIKVGLSRDVLIFVPVNIIILCLKPTLVFIKGFDKQAVSSIACQIRSIKVPDSYKGKGIRYENELVCIKPGKQK